MKTDDFDYELPAELVAQSPTRSRQDSRLLIVGEPAEACLDETFSHFEHFCSAGDLLVLNNTRVVPARLHCHKLSGGRVEVMLERQVSETEFLALVRANKSLKAGQVLKIQETEHLQFIERVGMFFKFRILDAAYVGGYALFHAFGEIPLPPYIKRQVEAEDSARYQTVFARTEGAVAAPTAGLHFDDALMARLAEKGVRQGELTLHVGAGTFQPVKVDDVTTHQMHREWIDVNQDLVTKIRQTKAAGKRVIAIGTTTVRALETAALTGELAPYHDYTDIFIYPGFQFRVVDALLTNFHLPKSTLLMMISAFGGAERIKKAYAHAIEHRYRFFSYGDAMLLSPYSDNI